MRTTRSRTSESASTSPPVGALHSGGIPADARLPRVHGAGNRPALPSGRHLKERPFAKGVLIRGAQSEAPRLKLASASASLVDQILEDVRAGLEQGLEQPKGAQTRQPIPIRTRLVEVLKELHQDTRGGVDFGVLLRQLRTATGSVLRVLTGIEYIGPQVMIQRTWNRSVRAAHLGKLGAILPREPAAGMSAEAFAAERSKNARLVIEAIRAIDRNRLVEHLDKSALQGVTFAKEPLKLAVLVFEKLLGTKQNPFSVSQLSTLHKAIEAEKKGVFVVENNTYRVVVDTRGEQGNWVSRKWNQLCFKVGELAGRHAHAGYSSSIRVSRLDLTPSLEKFKCNFLRIGTDVGLLLAGSSLAILTPPLFGPVDTIAKCGLLVLVGCGGVLVNPWSQNHRFRQVSKDLGAK